MVTVSDVAWFVAELAVYVGVAWWGATRPLPVVGRIILAVIGITLMGLSWGFFAAPQAAHPLSGSVNIIFRVVWFSLGALALATAATRAWLSSN